MPIRAKSPGVRQFLPTRESLLTHETPQWFCGAKLGIFVHWGLYSVPAWAPTGGEPGSMPWPEFYINNPYSEWYLNSLKFADSPTRRHHDSTYGADFDYYDFVPMFLEQSREWHAERWAQLAVDAGAKYMVLTTKHHDGYCLWPSSVPLNMRTRHEMRSARDYVGEFCEAVRARGVRAGLYYSGGLDWQFYKSVIDDLWPTLFKSIPQYLSYATYVEDHFRELIDRYEPDMLWNDIGLPDAANPLCLFADFFNRVDGATINDRWSSYSDLGDFSTPEYQVKEEISPDKWETCRGVGMSFACNRAEGPEHVLSREKLITMFVDIVSKNGNLLLGIGPDARGDIPPLHVDRLKALGAWLAVNGEAIYESSCWTRAAGTTACGTQVRFTCKADTLYAFLCARPAHSEIMIEGLEVPDPCRVEWLETGEILRHERRNGGLAVVLPAVMLDKTCPVMRITPMQGSRSDRPAP